MTTLKLIHQLLIVVCHLYHLNANVHLVLSQNPLISLGTCGDLTSQLVQLRLDSSFPLYKTPSLSHSKRSLLRLSLRVVSIKMSLLLNQAGRQSISQVHTSMLYTQSPTNLCAPFLSMGPLRHIFIACYMQNVSVFMHSTVASFTACIR